MDAQATDPTDASDHDVFNFDVDFENMFEGGAAFDSLDFEIDYASDVSEEPFATVPEDPNADKLKDLESDFLSLTLEAETILSQQPRFTQVRLAHETKYLFKHYEKYGSMARLKLGVGKFLRLGDEGGKMQIKDDATLAQEKKDMEEFKLALKRDQTGRPAHYGEAFMLNFTATDDQQKFNPKTDFVTEAKRDYSVPEESSVAFSSHPLRIIHPESIPLVTTLPWDPLATKVNWPARLRWPKGILSALNKILSLADYESRMRLFHHVTKWGPSPVFRAGIAEKAIAQFGDLFETAEEHYLGLTPESRAFLRGIYFQKQHLKPAERRMLALACRIPEESVQFFWEDMADNLMGYEGMRIFMAAREVEKNKEAHKLIAEAQRIQELKHRQKVFSEQDEKIRAAQMMRDPDALARFQFDGDAGKEKAREGMK